VRSVEANVAARVFKVQIRAAMIDKIRSRISRDDGRTAARAALRGDLLRWRRQLSAPWRRTADAAIARQLQALLASIVMGAHGPAGPCVVGVYWPVRGEPDLTDLFGSWSRGGARLGLPVVDAPDAPLRFVAWAPGDATTTAAMGIPRPAADTTVTPEVMVVPCVGFDARCHRLGYGGGFYDRTLAMWRSAGAVAVRAVGVGYDAAEIADLGPAVHDQPLDAVVTQSRVLLREPSAWPAAAR
jgi:5,10-methenyltetrahydrofolate synthetase